MGHTLSGKGVTPKPELVESICRLQSPSCKEELQHFLGMAEYYNKFVKGFANLCTDMRSLLRKGIEFSWSEACEKEFRALKHKLSLAPSLGSFNPGAPSILITDASHKGLGAVLKQGKGGKERT